MRCGKCGKDNREARRFCAECGAALAVKCEDCGASNEPEEKFCGEGRALLVEHAKQIKDSGADYRRLFGLVKTKLAKERGFTL